MGRRNRGLSPAHEIFLTEYLSTGNAKRSYMKAFPHCREKTAEANSSRLLRNAEIKKRLKKNSENADVSVEMILRELADMASRNIEEIAKLPGGTAAKTKSLELLGKYRKLFTDRIEHEGTVTLEVVTGVPRPPGDDDG